MTTSTQEYSDASLGTLVSGILNDAQDLINDQLEMVKSEMKAEFHKTKDSTLDLGIGLGVALVGGLFLCLMLVHLLDWGFPGLPLWACFGIVGTPMLAGGIWLYHIAKKRLEQVVPPYPEESIETAKETIDEIRRSV